jgi:hypothetical protein
MNESDSPGKANHRECEEQKQRTFSRWAKWLLELKESGNFGNVGLGTLEIAYVVGPNWRNVEKIGTQMNRVPIWGSIVIEADSFAQAVELARSCPILETGGCVEVRPIAMVDTTCS